LLAHLRSPGILKTQTPAQSSLTCGTHRMASKLCSLSTDGLTLEAGPLLFGLPVCILVCHNVITVGVGATPPTNAMLMFHGTPNVDAHIGWRITGLMGYAAKHTLR
jgi:hypothetical protein